MNVPPHHCSTASAALHITRATQHHPIPHIAFAPPFPPQPSPAAAAAAAPILPHEHHHRHHRRRIAARYIAARHTNTRHVASLHVTSQCAEADDITQRCLAHRRFACQFITSRRNGAGPRHPTSPCLIAAAMPRAQCVARSLARTNLSLEAHVAHQERR